MGGGSTHVEVKPDTTETEPDTTMATSNPQPPSQKLKDFWGKYVVPKDGPAETTSKEPAHDKAEAANKADTTDGANTATESDTASEHSNIPNKDGEASAGSTDHTDARSTHTTPLPKPAAIDTEPCISPQEQAEQMHNDPKPKRGRPSKKSIAAKAAAKAKAKGSDTKSTRTKASKTPAKAKARAKAKATAKAKVSKGKRKAAVAEPEVAKDVDNTCEEEHQDEEHEDESGPEHDSTAGSSTDINIPKPKATKRQSKATKRKGKSSKAKKDSETIADTPTPSSKTKGKNKKAAKADTKKKEPTGSTKRKPQEKTDEQKALLSRKSCAYKKARGEARKAGLSEDEVLKAAKKARHACVLVQKLLTYVSFMLSKHIPSDPHPFVPMEAYAECKWVLGASFSRCGFTGFQGSKSKFSFHHNTSRYVSPWIGNRCFWCFWGSGPREVELNLAQIEHVDLDIT